MIEACPMCDSADLRVRKNTYHDRNADGKKYYCDNCRSGFDTPNQREPKQDSRFRNGLAGKLVKIGEENE